MTSSKRLKALSIFLFSFLILTFSFVFFSCPAEDNKPGPEPDDPSLIVMNFTTATAQPGSEVNIKQDFFGFCHAGTTSFLDREYEILDELGAVWVHWDFSWSTIQPTETTWNLGAFDSNVKRAKDEGKKVIGMLLYDVDWAHTKMGNPPAKDIRKVWLDELPYFTEYAVKTVQHYNGKNGRNKVDAWLIWNEPDLADRFWSNPKTDPTSMEDFYKLTKATATAIRELDKTEGTHTELIGGVFTSTVSDAWVNGLLGYEDVKDLLDGVAFHPYGPNPVSCVDVFKDFKQKVKPYGFEDKVWLNEMGYPTYTDKGPIPTGRFGTDQWEGDMPRVVTQALTLFTANGARNLNWYHLFDSANRKPDDSESWFGLLWRKVQNNPDEWVKKGGYWGYALCANNLPGKTYKKMNFTRAIPANIQNYYFEGQDGKRVLVVWNTDPLDEFDIRITLGGSSHKLWDPATGASTAIEKTSTHTLFPSTTSQKTLVFITWEE